MRKYCFSRLYFKILDDFYTFDFSKDKLKSNFLPETSLNVENLSIISTLKTKKYLQSGTKKTRTQIILQPIYIHINIILYIYIYYYYQT